MQARPSTASHLSLAVSLVVSLASCGPETSTTTTESASETSASETSGAGSSTSTPTSTSTSTSTTTSTPTSTDPPPTGGVEVDVSGEFLLSVATIIDPTHPLHFLAEIEGGYGAAGGAMDLTLQALAVDLQATEPNPELVGAPLELLGLSLSEAGAFELALTNHMIVGAANPITGSDIELDVTLTGAFVNNDSLCGVVTGEVLAPLQLNLEGSTFGGVRVAGVDALVPSVSACEQG